MGELSLMRRWILMMRMGWMRQGYKNTMQDTTSLAIILGRNYSGYLLFPSKSESPILVLSLDLISLNCRVISRYYLEICLIHFLSFLKLLSLFVSYFLCSAHLLADTLVQAIHLSRVINTATSVRVGYPACQSLFRQLLSMIITYRVPPIALSVSLILTLP